jgi:hypothetical protein
MNVKDNFLCEFKTQDWINFECIKCGMKIRAEQPQNNMPILICNKPLHRSENEAPSFAKKLQNFAKSTVQHVTAGMPMCTEEEIIQRHNVCLGCEFFKDDTCIKCGCPLIRTKQFVSKLAWADQECPVGKWGKIQRD